MTNKQLAYCAVCNQMTNHRADTCLKCEARDKSIQEDTEQKIIAYATADDGDGHVQRIGVYESIEDIVIHTGMFNNVEITFEYDNRKD